MQWLNLVAEELIKRQPTGEILVQSGVSPSGTYHVGTLREVLTADAIVVELRRRKRQARHIHFVDDLDPFRKVPVNVPASHSKYLGQPLCAVPAPDGSGISYADFFLGDFLQAAKALKLDMEIIRSHQKYQSGDMVPALEKALAKSGKIGNILSSLSGRQLDENWSPIQVTEDNYLKNRRFVAIDAKTKQITYQDADGEERKLSYKHGEVKLNWRIDWPARWWLLGISAEPFGRDHATKGGSYDTGAAIIRQVFGAEPPLPIPYQFINQTGQTKKMSKSTGNIIASSELVNILPPEVVRYFILRYSPDKQLFFDQTSGSVKLVDDFAELLAKKDKSKADEQLIAIATNDIEPTVSSVPFSHLVASYQAALKTPQKTLEILKRTEYQQIVLDQAAIINRELAFIDRWLSKWAPKEVKFELAPKVQIKEFSSQERQYLEQLSTKIVQAPKNADGEWFHKTIYDLAGQQKIEPKQAFSAIYKATIGQTFGPRAGWFLSILPREWLITRLELKG